MPHLACASTSSLESRPIHPKQSAEARALFERTRRNTGSIVSARVVAKIAHGFFAPIFRRSSTSREVCDPSAHAGRDALSGAAKPPDDPALTFYSGDCPRGADLLVAGGVFAVFRRAEVMRCCSTWGRRLRYSSIWGAA